MSRWVVHARAGFGAWHGLTSYRGQAEPSHHHDWQVAIRAGTDMLNGEGYAVDFGEVQRVLREATSPLEGVDLNRDPEIGSPSPTAERLAVVLAGRLQQPLADLGATLLSISVWEGPDNRVDLILD